MNRILHISEADYHADPCETPSLSSSLAKVIIKKSLRHAYHMHPRLGGGQPKQSSVMSFGTLVHELVLNDGRNIDVLFFPDYKTNKAKEARDHSLAAGRKPLLEKDALDIDKIATSVRKELHAIGVSGLSRTEIKIAFEDEGVQCRAMVDAITHTCILDLKTTEDASDIGVQRAILNYGYDIQAHAYRKAVHTVLGVNDGALPFVFLFVEKDPPFVARAVVLSGAMEKLGQLKWDRARKLWKQALETGEWPVYSRGVSVIDAPPWAISQEVASEDV